MNYSNIFDRLEKSLKIVVPGTKLSLVCPALTTIAKTLGAMAGSMLVLSYLGIGSQYHLPHVAAGALYAILGWLFIKYLKVWTLSADSTLKAALIHAALNALGWAVLCFAGTVLWNDGVSWLPTIAVFTYVFTVVGLSDVLVWTTRRIWHFVFGKLLGISENE